MKLVSVSSISLSAVFGGLAVFMAYSLTSKFADETAASQVLRVGVLLLISGLAAMLILMRPARRSAIARVIFAAIFVLFGLGTLPVALALPLFLVFPSTSALGLGIYAYAVTFTSYQLARAHQDFSICWATNQEQAFSRYQNATNRVMNTELFLEDLGVEPRFYLPGPLQALEGLLSVALVLSMLAGLNLRKVFPEFSCVAWGIPALTCAAIFLEIVLIRVRLAVRLWGLQRVTGLRWGADNEDRTLNRKKQLIKKKPHRK
jgi:hypothetical protein